MARVGPAGFLDFRPIAEASVLNLEEGLLRLGCLGCSCLRTAELSSRLSDVNERADLRGVVGLEAEEDDWRDVSEVLDDERLHHGRGAG